MILKRERDAIDYLLMAAIGLGVVLALIIDLFAVQLCFLSGLVNCGEP